MKEDDANQALTVLMEPVATGLNLLLFEVNKTWLAKGSIFAWHPIKRLALKQLEFISLDS